MLVRFYFRAVESGTDESGIPVYSDVPFVQITMDSSTTVDRRAKDNDFERFPDQYAFFLKTEEHYEPIENKVPLEMWPVCKPADVKSLAARGIRTVEDLAAASADKVKMMPPSVAVLVKSAKNYLSMAGGATKLTKKMDDLEAQNAELREEVSLLRMQLKAAKEKADA
jgi:hypothetical protein